MANPRTAKRKVLKQFSGFHEHVHDFAWMVDWRAAGRPYCHVYVVGPVDAKPVKVGIAVNGASRLGELQVGNWNDLYVHHSVWLDTVADARQVESETHRALRRHHLSGEWFNVTVEQAAEAVADAADRLALSAKRGIPDDLFDSVFELIRAKIIDEYDLGSEMLQEMRMARIAKYGVRRAVNDQIRAKDYEFPLVDHRAYSERPKSAADQAEALMRHMLGI